MGWVDWLVAHTRNLTVLGGDEKERRSYRRRARLFHSLGTVPAPLPESPLWHDHASNLRPNKRYNGLATQTTACLRNRPYFLSYRFFAWSCLPAFLLRLLFIFIFSLSHTLPSSLPPSLPQSLSFPPPTPISRAFHPPPQPVPVFSSQGGTPDMAAHPRNGKPNHPPVRRGKRANRGRRERRRTDRRRWRGWGWGFSAGHVLAGA